MLLAVLFTAGTLLSHAQKKFTSAFEMNEYMVTITDSLYQGGTDWGKALMNSIKTRDFSELSKVRKKMENFIERKQKELTNMDDNWGSEKLRLAFLDFLSFEKLMLTEAFLPFEKLDKNTSEEQIKAAVAGISKFSEQEVEANKKILVAQQAFADKNGFTLEDN